jgi:rhodanese-related sulfurtransferase
VVDVRDDDFAGGHVKGCLRAPFQEYEAGVADLVSKLKDVPTVVFHCTLSQVR